MDASKVGRLERFTTKLYLKHEQQKNTDKRALHKLKVERIPSLKKLSSIYRCLFHLHQPEKPLCNVNNGERWKNREFIHKLKLLTIITLLVIKCLVISCCINGSHRRECLKEKMKRCDCHGAYGTVYIL